MHRPAPPSLTLLPAGRREVLLLLKDRGPLPAPEIARGLEVTVSAVRQHLRALEGDDVVTHEKVRDGPGRPLHVYRLSDRGDALFERRHGELANELLGYLEDRDPDLVEALFDRRRDRRVTEARRRLEGLSFARKVEELGRILDEDGYHASVRDEDDGTFRIVERNCAVRGVAERYPGPCRSEIEFLRSVLPGAEVERSTHIARGDHACSYVVRPSQDGGAASPEGDEERQRD